MKYIIVKILHPTLIIVVDLLTKVLCSLKMKTLTNAWSWSLPSTLSSPGVSGSRRMFLDHDESSDHEDENNEYCKNDVDDDQPCFDSDTGWYRSDCEVESSELRHMIHWSGHQSYDQPLRFIRQHPDNLLVLEDFSTSGVQLLSSSILLNLDCHKRVKAMI